MWNIVKLDGNNYLVDVTNSDAGTVGADGGLFLAGGTGSVQDGYTVHAVSYTYDPVSSTCMVMISSRWRRRATSSRHHSPAR